MLTEKAGPFPGLPTGSGGIMVRLLLLEGNNSTITVLVTAPIGTGRSFERVDHLSAVLHFHKISQDDDPNLSQLKGIACFNIILNPSPPYNAPDVVPA